MNVLVVGGGAREHAICDAVARAENASLYSVMSNLNPGIERLALEYLCIKETQVDDVVAYAQKKHIDCALVGPEAPLEAGLVDALTKQGIRGCAPTRNAARIETDKEWMRSLLTKYRVRGQLRHKSFTDPAERRSSSNSLTHRSRSNQSGLPVEKAFMSLVIIFKVQKKR